MKTRSGFKIINIFVMALVLLGTVLNGTAPVFALPVEDLAQAPSAQGGAPTTFAIISDYGTGPGAAPTANMVHSWNPAFIITAGDNHQGTNIQLNGTYAQVVGAYYGATAGEGRNYVGDGKFWPVPGNHDQMVGINNYTAYFNYLPPVDSSSGSTNLYYDIVRGPVHFFMMDSEVSDKSTQKTWLQPRLETSTAPWKIVVFHTPAASAGTHGSSTAMQWDFAGWGADFVIQAHNHIYERIEWNDIVYFTTGAGGGNARSEYNTSYLPTDAVTKAHQVSSNANGATKVTASNTEIKFEFYTNNTTEPKDTYTQTREAPPAYAWEAFNDCVVTGSISNPANTTTIQCYTNNATGELKNFTTGEWLDIHAAVTANPSNKVDSQTGSSLEGAIPKEGTDAHDLFNGKASILGGVRLQTSETTVTLTITGLDPEKTYTFATTANRGDDSYTKRKSGFELSDVDSAVNASSTGTETDELYTKFWTGYNTDTGYVARWENISPGSDGDFVVTFSNAGEEATAYGPAVFYLAEEMGAGQTYALNVATDGNGSVELSPAGGVYKENQTVTLTPKPNPGFAFSHWSGDLDGSDNPATIVMNENKSVTAYFEVSLCTTIPVMAEADTHMRSGYSRASQNFGGSPLIRLNPYYQQGSDDGQFTGALLRWNVSGITIPDGATVDAASITFNVTDGSNNAYSLYNMRRSWVEGTRDGASGTGASWNYYDAESGSWGTAGAQNTSSDRDNTNLWNATANDFNKTGSVTFDLNSDGLAVVQGWLAGTIDNYGLTIQNYSGSAVDIWEAASKEHASLDGPTLSITYCMPTTDPTISTSVSALEPFNTEPGVPSATQTYTVQGVNLEGDITITAPNGFEISTDGVNWVGNLTLTENNGKVDPTTILVHLIGAVGEYSGNITHVSADLSKVVAVSGTIVAKPPWTAYNDMAGTSTPANTTEHTMTSSSPSTPQKLKDFETGIELDVTMTVAFSPTGTSKPGVQTSVGGNTNSGTEAYEVFNGKVDLKGIIMSAVTGTIADYWVDVTFNGLNPNKTYTFVTTTNRAGGDDYATRETRFTISGMLAATNASTEGVVVRDEFGYSVSFITGENSANGYVARWVNIKPAADGSFTVRAQPFDSENPRVPSWGGFMLQEEASVIPTHTVTFDGNGATSGTMSPQTASTSTALTPNAFERTGYTFAGWNTQANGGGTAYADKEEYDFTADLILYAQWTANTHTVTFDANGGTGTMTPQIANAPTALTPNAFERTGYTFAGWNTKADGSGTAYDDEAEYDFTADLELYAQWTINTYTLAINVSVNGSVSKNPDQDTYSHGEVVTLTATPVQGYSFLGWGGDLEGDTNPVQLEMDGNKVVDASFSSETAPPLPSNFHGKILYIEDDGAPDVDHLVQAYLDNMDEPICSTKITTNAGQLVYAINVLAYPDGTLPTQVTFKINGRVVAIAAWVSGSNVPLDFHPPKADAGGSYVALLDDELIALAGSVADKGNDVESYVWSLHGDGLYGDAPDNLQPSFAFSATGVYPVSLMAVDAQGGQGFGDSLVFVITVDGLIGQVYDGDPKSVTVSPLDGYDIVVLYDGSPTPPTNADSYAVTIQIKKDGVILATYEAGNMEIGKATASVTLTGLEHTYDGTTKAATATTAPTDLTVMITYDGSETPPSAAGSYYAVATVVDDNYVGTASGTLVIAKAIAEVTLDDLEHTYDGDPKAAVATTSPEGLDVVITYDGSEDQPSAAGSYAVTATIDDINYQGSKSGTLVIAKADATVTLSDLAQTYDGNPKPVTITTAPLGLSVEVTYAGSSTAPSAAGSYAVTATIDDINYQGSKSGTLVIAKATPTIITNPTASPITEGQSLADSTLIDGEASVDGSFTWTYPDTIPELSDSGEKLFDVTFTPNDSANYNNATTKITLIVNQDLFTHEIDLVVGWNLVSFNLTPIDPDIEDVLASIEGKYTLVYAWDATGGHGNAGHWMRHAAGGILDSLETLDETQGFWIFMTEAATLKVTGTAPVETEIPLTTTATGWNLVGYPSSLTPTPPALMGEIDYTLIITYFANDLTDPWKLYDPEAPTYANDLEKMLPGYGYWIFVNTGATLEVPFK